MEVFLNYQNHVEGILILCSILIGGYFLFTDNIAYFEKKDQKSENLATNDMQDSVDKFGSYFKDLFVFILGFVFGNMIKQPDAADTTSRKGDLIRFGISIPILLLVISISGFIGKSISMHWMDQANGFHFGMKNMWAPSCTFDAYVNNIITFGERKEREENSSDTSKRHLFFKGLLGSGTMMDDNMIKLMSFNRIYPQYEGSHWYCYTDSSSIAYDKTDTLSRFATKELRAISTTLNLSSYQLKDSVYYLNTNSALQTKSFSPSKDTVTKSTVTKYMFRLTPRDKRELYHFAKNFFVQNSETYKEVMTNIKDRTAVINFSRTLALAFYILFLFMFINLIMNLSRTLSRFKGLFLSTVLILLCLLLVNKLYFLMNFVTLLIMILSVILYFVDYHRHKNNASPVIKNLRKARRLSLVLSLCLTFLGMAGYLIASVNWKSREIDANMYVLGSFKNVILNTKENEKIPKNVYNILLPASNIGTIFKAGNK